MQELKNLKIWTNWKPEKRADGSLSKPPINSATGGYAKSDTPATWHDYSEAMKKDPEHLGFMLSAGEFKHEFCVIDLDNCVNENGELTPLASEIVSIMDSYTEFSPSGRGLHIIFKCNSELPNKKENGVEFYTNRKFLTFTENIYGSEKPIEERTAQAKKVFEKYCKKSEEKTIDVKEVMFKYSPNASDLWLDRWQANPRYWDKEGNPDDNRADLALCNYLMFYTGKDFAQCDNLFRQSGLMRPKWDEKHDSAGHTYGEMTLSKAYSGVTNTYDPKKGILTPQNDFTTVKEAKTLMTDDSLTAYMDTFLRSDYESFIAYGERKTGFKNLDEFITLYPGLYVLGAISSIGKTTFSLQIACNLAKKEIPVLFFSLEMTKYELFTKIFTRSAFERGTFIQNARKTLYEDEALFKEETTEIKKYSDYLRIIGGGFDTTIADISAVIEKHKEEKPVVFIDYLQVIKPMTDKITTKDAIDRAVRELKTLANNYGLTIIVISSFNRTNYLTPVDFESFKESGGIEYTADVVLGLQLSILSDDVFSKEGNIKKKRDLIREAKKASPRKVELQVLKNRYGRLTGAGDIVFDYMPVYDFFTPVKTKPAEFTVV